MAGAFTAFGSPIGYPGQQIAWGLSPYGGQSLGTYSQAQQIPQLLQAVPQQLQQLHYLQQQQLQILQQLIQVVPQQLQQLQQLIQYVPHQIQQLQQQLQSQQVPFGQATAGLGGIGLGQPGTMAQAFSTPLQSTPPFGPQGFVAQPFHVM